MNNISRDSIILNIFFLIIIVLVIYSMFFKKLKNYKDCINRSATYKMLFNYKKANNILIEALKLNNLSRGQNYGLLLSISKYYYTKKDYTNAIAYFEKAFQLIQNEKFRFNSYYIKIIECYILEGKRERAIELYSDFLARQKYDLKFKKINKVGNLLEIE